ncbi:MAG: class I SAM-dependent methyltransferase [Desulfatirhabdiaceae bacterium]
MNIAQKLLLTESHICPWWLAYTFDNPFRRLIHRPETIFGPHLQTGMTAVDLGCGMGFFSIALSKLVGNTGKVVSVDIQQQMLDILLKRAGKAGVAHRIHTHRGSSDAIGLPFGFADLVLAFWMVHEVPQMEMFIQEIFMLLKPGGKFLLVEPKIHVPLELFERIYTHATRSGFAVLENPRIALSHATWFKKY